MKRNEPNECENFVHCALLGDGMVGKTCLTLSFMKQLFTDSYTATVFDNYPVPVKVSDQDFVVSVFDTAGQSEYESVRAYTYDSSEVLVLCFSVCDRESFHSVISSWLPEVQHHTKGKRPLLVVGTQTDLRPSPPAQTCCIACSSSTSTSSSSSCAPSLAPTPSNPCSRSPSSVSSSSTSSASSYSSFSSSSSTSSTTFYCCPSTSSSPSLPSASPSSSSTFYVTPEEGRLLAEMVGAEGYIECSARTQDGMQQVFESVVLTALKYRRKKSSVLGKLFVEKKMKKRLSKKRLGRLAASLIATPAEGAEGNLDDSAGKEQ